MAGTLAVWAGSHFFGVGEVVDLALLLVGAFTIGWSSLQAARGSTVGEVLTIRRPGLVPVEPEPAGTGLFRTLTVTGNPGMAAGEGATTAFADVEYSTAGTATDQELVRLHDRPFTS